MIRIRNSNGSVTSVPHGCFVELVNDHDHNVVNLVFFQQDPNTVIQVVPSSKEALRYEGMFASKGVKFSKDMILRER